MITYNNIKFWTSPKRYISNFNKIRKVGDGVTYTCIPFTYNAWGEIKTHDCDVELLTLQIVTEINKVVLETIYNSDKVPFY